MVATLVEHYLPDYLLFGAEAPQWVVKAMMQRPPHKDSLLVAAN
jgi:hypothetical protein